MSKILSFTIIIIISLVGFMSLVECQDISVANLPEYLSRLFFGNVGNVGGFFFMFNCAPFNRTFIQHGTPCLQPNLTALNCQNQTCTCGSFNQGLPSLPGVSPPPPPGLAPPGGMMPPGFPFPSMPTPPMTVWNCTTFPVPTFPPPSLNSSNITGPIPIEW